MTNETLALIITLVVATGIVLSLITNRYSVTHLIILDGGTVKTLETFGYPTKAKARKAIEEIVNSIVCDGQENLYYTSLIKEENQVTLTVRETKHILKINSLWRRKTG